ncbi:hypothetical protein D3C85_1365720 [compost metagenome]
MLKPKRMLMLLFRQNWPLTPKLKLMPKLLLKRNRLRMLKPKQMLMLMLLFRQN